MTVLVNLLNTQFKILYYIDLSNVSMENKKIKEELDEQLDRENSGISCDACPIDSAIKKLFSIFRHKN